MGEKGGAPAAPAGRLESIDALRGFDMFWIIDLPKVAAFFPGGVARHSGSFAPVVLAAGVLAAQWLFLLYLYRRGLFLRV